MKYDKPIAILASSIHKGFDWARENLEIREYNGAKRRIVEITGQEYYVCSSEEHLRGYEFHNIIVVDFVDSDIIELANTRVK